MKKLSSLRPSPAMVVAVVALVAALGGSAYAAATIGTKQIKNNAITTSKIKKNAVTSAKIRNGAVTGAKLNLSTVGTVPSATHASTADSATNAKTAETATSAKTAGTATSAKTAETATNALTAETATNALNFSHYKSSGVVKASAGQQVTVWTAGPFTATGICEESGAGEFEAYTELTTSAVGSSAASEAGQYHSADFEPGEELELGYSVASTEPELNEDGYGNYYESFTAVSPDGGTLLNGISVSAVNYFGSDCAFFGEMTNGG